ATVLCWASAETKRRKPGSSHRTARCEIHPGGKTSNGPWPSTAYARRPPCGVTQNWTDGAVIDRTDTGDGGDSPMRRCSSRKPWSSRRLQEWLPPHDQCACDRHYIASYRRPRDSPLQRPLPPLAHP